MNHKWAYTTMRGETAVLYVADGGAPWTEYAVSSSREDLREYARERGFLLLDVRGGA